VRQGFIVDSIIRKPSSAVLFTGLILSYIVVESAFNPLMIYTGLALFSLFLSMILLKSYRYRSYTYLLAAFTSIYLVNRVFWAIIEPHPVLVWDHKAMANLAEYIAVNGFVPRPEQAPAIGSRIEYASYPASFTLWAVSSMILGASPEDLMVSPVLILPMILVFTYALYLLLPRNPERGFNSGGVLYVLFGAGVVSSLLFIRPRYYFIYQDFSRYFLLLYSSLLFINVVRNEGKTSKTVLVLVSTLIVFSHGESSIALVILVVSLLVSVTMSRRSMEARRHVLFLLAAIIVFFGIYYLWAITTFTKTLFNMIRQVLESLITGAEVGLGKYTPHDYTLVDLVLLASSVLAVVLVSLSALIKALLLHRRMPLMLIPLLVSSLSMVSLFAFTPYKSDISLKFIYITAICIAMFLTEVRDSRIEAGPRFKSNVVLALALTTVLVMGVMVLEGYTKEPVIPYQVDQYSVQYQLNNAVYPLFSSALREYDIHVYIVDSPLMPYYYIRDFLEPRGLSTYMICYLHVDESQYSILQKNGIPTPRFTMLSSSSEYCFDNHPLYGFISRSDLVEVGVNYSVILSTSRLGILYTD